MPRCLTNNVEVEVESSYQANSSHPDHAFFVFAYKIKLRNHGESAVKLLRRHWYIHSADLSRHEVEGEGVVGEQPIIQPGEEYEYVSGCQFETEFGKMHGHYTFEDLESQETFEVAIPEFMLEVPYLLN